MCGVAQRFREPGIPLGAGEDERHTVQALDRGQRGGLVLALFDATNLKDEVAVQAQLGEP